MPFEPCWRWELEAPVMERFVHLHCRMNLKMLSLVLCRQAVVYGMYDMFILLNVDGIYEVYVHQPHLNKTKQL